MIFPNLVRQFAANGADFMVTVTNDAWFGPSSAPYQHFGMVVFRAVENHVAFARRRIPGISSSSIRMAACCSSHRSHPRGAAGTIPSASTDPFYSQYGDLFCVCLCYTHRALCLTGYFSHDTEPAGGEPAGETSVRKRNVPC